MMLYTVKNILLAQCLAPETTEFADVVDEIYKPASPKMWLKDVFWFNVFIGQPWQELNQ